MKLIFEDGDYKLEAERQETKTVWLIREFMLEGEKETPIATNATTWGYLVRKLNAKRKET